MPILKHLQKKRRSRSLSYGSQRSAARRIWVPASASTLHHSRQGEQSGVRHVRLWKLVLRTFDRGHLVVLLPPYTPKGAIKTNQGSQGVAARNRHAEGS